MGYKQTDECLKKVRWDEPIFVLRAQDKLAPILVEHWAELAQLLGAPREKTDEAIRLVARMRDWADKNGAKVPD